MANKIGTTAKRAFLPGTLVIGAAFTLVSVSLALRDATAWLGLTTDKWAAIGVGLFVISGTAIILRMQYLVDQLWGRTIPRPIDVPRLLGDLERYRNGFTSIRDGIAAGSSTVHLDDAENKILGLAGVVRQLLSGLDSEYSAMWGAAHPVPSEQRSDLPELAYRIWRHADEKARHLDDFRTRLTPRLPARKSVVPTEPA